jgi:mRNA interferase MazF
MRRGDLVTAVLGRDFGKPRPAIVVQADIYLGLEFITLVPLTSHVLAFVTLRILLEPSPTNGLRRVSQAMIDKVGAVPREKVGPVIGHLSDDDISRVNRALAVFLGFA